jgi:hypothetical protein
VLLERQAKAWTPDRGRKLPRITDEATHRVLPDRGPEFTVYRALEEAS